METTFGNCQLSDSHIPRSPPARKNIFTYIIVAWCLVQDTINQFPDSDEPLHNTWFNFRCLQVFFLSEMYENKFLVS